MKEAAQEIGGDEEDEEGTTLRALGALVAANLMHSEEQDDGEPRLLHTVRAIGYILRARPGCR